MRNLNLKCIGMIKKCQVIKAQNLERQSEILWDNNQTCIELNKEYFYFSPISKK